MYSGDFVVVLNELHVALDEVGVVEAYSELGNSRLTSVEKSHLIRFLHLKILWLKVYHK